MVLVIMDGWGLAPPGPGNAVTLAKTPNLDNLMAVFPHTQLSASGEYVGLPKGEDGNSEVGHINLGAGRVVYQDLPRIDMAIADGSFFQNPAFLTVAAHVKEFNSSLHLMGLMGMGGVHSSLAHLFAFLHFAKEQNIEKVFLHLFTDGRDSPPTSASLYLVQIEEEIKKLRLGKIATICGRYFAMDRDWHWERTQKAYEVMVKSQGQKANSWQEAIKKAYQNGQTDEFILPTIISENGQPQGQVKDNDGVIFFNFRIDRPRQLTEAFVLPDFESRPRTKIIFDPYTEKYYKKTYAPPPATSQTFPRGPQLKNLFFVTMTEYERDLPVKAAFPPFTVKMPLARVLAEKDHRQLHLAETEKERFVTYYFDGQHEASFPGEDRVEIPSPDVPTYDLKPEMSAFEVTDFLLPKIREQSFHFVVVNFANPDMVGHTGVLSAGIRACEVVDGCVGKIVKEILVQNGACIISADHGNVEEMLNLQTGKVDTEHSTNPVPFILISNDLKGKSRQLPSGILADVAPTILDLIGLPKPSEMSGRSLIEYL